LRLEIEAKLNEITILNSQLIASKQIWNVRKQKPKSKKISE